VISFTAKRHNLSSPLYTSRIIRGILIQSQPQFIGIAEYYNLQNGFEILKNHFLAGQNITAYSFRLLFVNGAKKFSRSASSLIVPAFLQGYFFPL